VRWNRLRTILIALVALGATARASVAVRASVEDLAGASHCAVEGVVLDHATHLDRAAGVVWTRHRLRVDASLVGEPAKEIVVRVRGGKVGTLVQETIGAARLGDGERIVAFLGPEEDGAREVVGMAQGVFRVETDPKTGVTLCTNDVEGLSLVDAAGREVAPEPLHLTLSDLRTRVAAARERVEALRRTAREALDRRFAEWRRSALRHMEIARGRPGGPAAR
jgi:hypothetical protein